MDIKLKIESWDEARYREFPDGTGLTKADVVLSGDDNGITAATFEALMFYRADGSSTFVSLMRIEGALEGRAGSFLLEGRGDYDGTTASSTFEVIPGSGTGDLAGISGRGTSSATTEDAPFMPLHLTYELE